MQSPMSGTEKIATRDKIELKSKNSFIWLGRADFRVNSGGIKLFPEQLEQRVAQLMDTLLPGVAYFFFGEKDFIIHFFLKQIIESNLKPIQFCDTEKVNEIVFTLSADTKDQVEGVQAFLEKRKANWVNG